MWLRRFTASTRLSITLPLQSSQQQQYLTCARHWLNSRSAVHPGCTFSSSSIFSMSSPSPSSTSSVTPSPSPYTTQTWKVNPLSSSNELESQLAAASTLLHRDELVAFPTETVYGLAANALSSTALSRIYTAKGRPSDNPLIVHIHSHEQFHSLGRSIPQLALRMADHFWPGPLTLIIPTSLDSACAASSIARAGLDCVGVRMPSHPVALALLRACGLPLAAPSANLSGRPSPTTAAHVHTDLNTRIAGIIDGGSAGSSAGGVGLESTVIECTDATATSPQRVTILRPGGITREQLEEIAGKGNVYMDPALEVKRSTTEIQPLPKQTNARLGGEAGGAPSSAALNATSAAASVASPSSSSTDSAASSASSPGPRAPGMKYTHYAPRAPLLLVDGSLSFLLSTALTYIKRHEIVGILATDAARPSITQWMNENGVEKDMIHYESCGASRDDLNSIARDLYSCLRAFDETNVQIILSEIYTRDGVGEAVMNRLQKAAGGQCIKE